MSRNIPFLTLSPQHQQIKREIFQRWNKLYDQTEFIHAAEGRCFEAEFAIYNEAKHTIAVDNGTSALEIALRAMRVGPDDEVITVSNTFIATVAAIHFTGATPVFAEIDPQTYNIDPEDIKKRITTRTKAIIPVNLYGQPADLVGIRNIADKYGIKVLNDAAQSIGAKIKDNEGKLVDTHQFADITTFSFYPGKNLGACGEAGAIIAENDNYADFCRKFRDHGSTEKYIHEIIGRNHRMDAFQAAALRIKLRYIDEWNSKRRKVALWYQEFLSNCTGITLPFISNHVQSVFHLYVVLVEDRIPFMDYLQRKGIGTGLHYRIPVHLQKAFKYLNYKPGDLPITENIVSKNVSLPMYPELTRDDVAYISDVIINYFRGNF